MNDSDFRRWLDEGLAPERGPALRDRAGFVDRVMRQVETTPQARAVVALWPATPVPWWIRAAADPAAALACILMALFVWKSDGILVLATFLGERWSAFSARTLEPFRAALGLDRPAVTLGLELLAILAIGWLSIHLYRWSERVTRRSVRRSVGA